MTIGGWTMSIKQRRSSYEASVTNSGIRYRRSFKERLQAQIWEAQARADLIAGRTPEVSKHSVHRSLPRTLQELADYTYNTVWSGARSEETSLINANLVVATVSPGTLINDIDKATIDLAVSEWKKLGNSNATCNRKLSSISKMLTVAVELGILDRLPPIKRLRESPGRIRWYTDDEQDLIMDMFHRLGYPEHGEIVRVLLDTGMRCGELFNLKWEDIQGKLIVLNETKNFSPRSIPMTQATIRIITNQTCEVGPFKWTDARQTRGIWNKVRHQLGWSDDPGATLHACRHTFISNLVQEGVHIAGVQKLAGHKTIQMTLRYTHLSPHDLESAIEKLENRRSNCGTIRTHG